MTSLIERSDGTTIGPEECARRIELARQEYHKLPQAIQNSLKTAAIKGPLVRRALQEGFWTALVRALRGLALKEMDESFVHLAADVERLTPNALEG